MNHVNRNTYTPQKNFKVFNIPDLLKSLNVWNPKAGGKQGGGGPGGEGRRGTYRFLFLYPTMLSWTPWVPGRPLLPPPVGQEGETCLPRHPAIRQHQFNIERDSPQKRKNKICESGAASGPLVFNRLLFVSLIGNGWCQRHRRSGKGSRARGRGLRGMLTCNCLTRSPP